MKKYGALYSDLKLNFEIYSSKILLLPAIFAFRRASYVILALVKLISNQVNMTILIISNVLYLSWLQEYRPFNSRRLIHLETSNEVILLLLIYHIQFFTEFTSVENQIKVIMPIYLYLIAALIISNLGSLFYDFLQC